MSEICSLSLSVSISDLPYDTQKKETTKKNMQTGEIYIKLKIQIRSRLPITKENAALIMSNKSNSKGFTVITSKIHRQVNIKVFLLIFCIIYTLGLACFAIKFLKLDVAVSKCTYFSQVNGKSLLPSLPRQTRQQCMIV